jgi:DivIVA domain-containing protein
VADFILTVIAALIVGGLGFGLFTFVAGRDGGLAEPAPDGVAQIPDDRPLTAADLDAARFDVAIRGYRMDQVDRLVASSRRTISELEDRVRELEAGPAKTPTADRAR